MGTFHGIHALLHVSEGVFLIAILEWCLILLFSNVEADASPLGLWILAAVGAQPRIAFQVGGGLPATVVCGWWLLVGWLVPWSLGWWSGLSGGRLGGGLVW